MYMDTHIVYICIFNRGQYNNFIMCQVHKGKIREICVLIPLAILVTFLSTEIKSLNEQVKGRRDILLTV